ncbi:MAG: glycoside hydrolase family 1 protein [Weeksellaceae bacterium]
MKPIAFPKKFSFGIAESDLQTVGSILPQEQEAAQQPMWEVFSQNKQADTPGYGSYKYQQYKKDVKLITELGVKAYRTSISMSRTITADGKPNKKAIKWYRNYLSSLKDKGLEIHLCLYHWEAPAEFLAEGILDPKFEAYFLKHVKIVIEEVGDLVDYYIPINELWCISFLAYYIGIHAPGRKDIGEFFLAYFKSIELQTAVIKIIKELSPQAKIGIVNIHFPTYIQEENIANPTYIKARELADNITNFMYSDPFYFGSIDKSVIKKFKKYFPTNFKDILRQAKLAEHIDYYGVNYYNSQYVEPTKDGLGFNQVIPEEALKNSLGWPVSLAPYYPDGLTDILVTYTHRYQAQGLRNIVVSENGTPTFADTVNNVPQDDFRIFFIYEHLKQVHQAIAKGACVTGYFLWTLLDNYEWQEGYKSGSAFGLVAVDKQTGARTPKKSYFWYQQFLNNLYKKS